MTVKRILNFLTVAEQEEKKTKSVDETKTEEPPTSWHEVADTETGSEEDIHCSTAETSAYASTRIW